MSFEGKKRTDEKRDRSRTATCARIALWTAEGGPKSSMRDPFDEAEKHSPRFRDTYSLRRILAKEIRMNGEVERSQRRGYFAGAQSSDRVVPAETVKQACEFEERLT